MLWWWWWWWWWWWLWQWQWQWQWLLLLLLLKPLTYRAPSAATELADRTPQGRRTRMCVVFRRDRDVSSKNPASGVDPRRVAAWARRQGVLSFGYLFFAQAKKSNSLPAGE